MASHPNGKFRLAPRALAAALLALSLAGCAGQAAYREGQQLVAQDQVEAGLAKYREAVAADPGNAAYRAALLGARDRAATRLIDRCRTPHGQRAGGPRGPGLPARAGFRSGQRARPRRPAPGRGRRPPRQTAESRQRGLRTKGLRDRAPARDGHPDRAAEPRAGAPAGGADQRSARRAPGAGGPGQGLPHPDQHRVPRRRPEAGVRGDRACARA